MNNYTCAAIINVSIVIMVGVSIYVTREWWSILFLIALGGFVSARNTSGEKPVNSEKKNSTPRSVPEPSCITTQVIADSAIDSRKMKGL